MNYSHQETLTGAFSEFLAGAKPPCLSLYLPTHQSHPERQQNPILFRNLLKGLEKSLEQSYPDSDQSELLRGFEELANDEKFWSHPPQGLAVFAAPGMFHTFATPRTVLPLAMAADAFHIKPLIRLLQTAGRYQVLCINRQEIQLYEGNRDALKEIKLPPEFPRTLAALLNEPSNALYNINLDTKTTSSEKESNDPSPHSHHGRVHEKDSDVVSFFRAVDRAVSAGYSRPSGLPLVLAALHEHHTLFHKISQNPFIKKEGVEINPDSLSIDELRVRAWKVLEPKYQAKLVRLAEDYANAHAKGTGSDNLAEVAKMASSGGVKTLLVESERRLPGHIDHATGLIQRNPANVPYEDDLLDDLVELTSSKGGEVMELPKENMPNDAGFAATFRY